MAELYPSDSELNALSGTSDPQQEVLFIQAGESPYYTSFYKMLHRLLDVARRGGDLRVFKDGAMTFGVRAGKLADGDAALDFAGAAAQPLTANTVNHIYLTAAGQLVTDVVGFPSPSTTPHLPLATIAVANDSYSHTDITDYRGRALYQIQTGLAAAQASQAAGFFVQPAEGQSQAQRLAGGSNADALHTHGLAGLNSEVPIGRDIVDVPAFRVPCGPVLFETCDATAGWTNDIIPTLSATAGDNPFGLVGKGLVFQTAGTANNVCFKPIGATDLRNTQFCASITIPAASYDATTAGMNYVALVLGDAAGGWSETSAHIFDGGASNVHQLSAGRYLVWGTTAKCSNLFGQDVDLQHVTKIGFYIRRQNGVTPAVTMGGFGFFPKPAKAQIAFRFDASYATHFAAAGILARYGLRGTFYVDPSYMNQDNRLSTAQCREMQQMGHLIAMYMDHWNDDVVTGLPRTDAEKIERVRTRQIWMRQQGFVEGSRHIVHGNSNYWSADLEAAMIPSVISTVSYYGGIGSVGSPYAPRYHHTSSDDVGTANLAAIQADIGTAGSPGAFVLSGGKYVCLLHLNIGGAQDALDLAALDTLCATNIVPQIAAGTVECVTAADAVRKAYA